MGLSPPFTLDALPTLPLDPRSLVGRATETASRQLAAIIIGVPDEMIDALMRTPARRLVVETIFWLMPRYLDRTRAVGLDACLRWRVTSPERRDDPAIFDLDISDRRCRVTRGGGERRPVVTITIDAGEMVRLAAGKSTPMQAYFAGRLALRGDIMQAARLASLFRAPASRKPVDVQRPGSQA